MGKIKYYPGDRLGPRNVLLLERTKKSQKGYYYGKFQCPLCGKTFETSINHVTQGRTYSCGCHRDLTGQKFGMLTVIEKSDKYASDGRPLWKCKCDCGNYKYVGSNSLSQGLTTSCGCLKSKGEQKIQELLKNNDIRFYREYVFNDCINKETNAKLRFDFYLPDYNCCIEYDGSQHFMYSDKGWNTKEHFLHTKKLDGIRNQYCIQNNILLIRIPYTDFDKININYILDRIGDKIEQ